MIVEDGRAAELAIERRGQRSVVGNVWKGRVGNVLSGMEAAFVDVGLDKSGFLHVDEIVALGTPRNKRRITDMIKKGDEVLVQATKDPMGTKGVRLTMQLSLAGRFLVYTPYGEGVGVSRRLPDDERRRLRDVFSRISVSEGGVILRTAAAGVEAKDLARDLESLTKLWVALKKRAEKIKVPSPLYGEADISLKVIRDLLNEGVDAVHVDDQDQFDRITSFLKRTSPDMAKRVNLHEGPGPLLARNGAEEAIKSTVERRVPLNSGGYLIIDDTEALTVIDVNSGRNVGGRGNRLEDTVTATNLEAAEEVVRQLRLRDIGGIVVIDFIDMDKAKNRNAVLSAVNSALENDRTRSYVVPEISPLGLVQLSRQNRADGPREVMTEVCEDCGGAGWLLTDETLAIDAARRIVSKLRGREEKGFKVSLPSASVDALTADEDRLDELTAALGMELELAVDDSLPDDAIRIRRSTL